MEGISSKPKPEQEQETFLDIIKRLKKTSEAFQASHKLKGEDSASKREPKDQFKMIPPPKRSFLEMSQPPEKDDY